MTRPAPAPSSVMVGQAATAADYDEIVRDTRTVYAYADGGRAVVFLKRAVITAAAAVWDDVETLATPSLTRRAAAGAPDLAAFKRIPRFKDAVELVPLTPTTCRVRLADGRLLRQPMSNPVLSFLAGYSVERFTHRARPNLLTHRYPERWAASLPFFRGIDATLRAALPVHHAIMRERASLHPRWTIDGTALSTVTVNVDYESRYHYDTGDFENGVSTLTVRERGRYDGGFLVLPRLRLAFDVRDGDVLLFRAHKELHGNTAITKHTPDARRTSFVTYLKHALARATNAREGA